MDFTRPNIPAIAAVTPGKAPVSCIAFHEDGKRLFVGSSEDSRLQIIDCFDTGKAMCPALHCEREGIRVLETTHHDNCVLFAGPGQATQPVGQRHAVHYWSTYDNKILRKFRGHLDQVTGVSMSPADDTFLSSSMDRTVRLWNLQTAGCLAQCQLPSETIGTPQAVFDTTGLVFGIAGAMADQQGHYVNLYDARNFSAGPFAEMKVSQTDLEKAIQSHVNVSTEQVRDMSQAPWHSLVFNQSGSQLLVGSAEGMSFVLDGFEGTVQRVLAAKSRRPAVSCFTTDDKTVLASNDDGSITCWDVHSGDIVRTLSGHLHPVNCIKPNPKFAQLASCCKDTALWLFVSDDM